MGLVCGTYDAKENILRLRHPAPVVLSDRATMEEFFREVSHIIAACAAPPWLLVDYTNLEISADMTLEYASHVKSYRPAVRGVYRYKLSNSTEGVLTQVAVLIANKRDANIFPDEATALAALRQARDTERPAKLDA
jgi:hypothetical protein